MFTPRPSLLLLTAAAVLWIVWAGWVAAAGPPVATDFGRDIEPILRKYCVGCHGEEEANAELRLDSWKALMKGGEAGRVVVPGSPSGSKLVQVLSADAENRMPPEDEAQPAAEEVALLKRWIAQGAKRPVADRVKELAVPEVRGAAVTPPVVSLAVDARRATVAVGRFGTVEWWQLRPRRRQGNWDVGLACKINALVMSPDGKWAVAGGGIPGLQGRLFIWDRQSSRPADVWIAHQDAVDAVALSPDGRYVASGGHDRVIRIWDFQKREVVRELAGHNGGVFALTFDSTSRALASASADETIKIWDVESGKRTDTLGQPQGAQYAVAYGSSGRWLAAGGADNRLRIWQCGEAGRADHRLVVTRYAHERPIVQLGFSPDGSLLFTASEDLTIKIWETQRFEEVAVLSGQSDVPSAVAWVSNERLAVGRLDGSFSLLGLPAAERRQPSHPLVATPKGHQASGASQDTPDSLVEREPNDSPADAHAIRLPSVVEGRLAGGGSESDRDWFRFHADEGETWIFETVAGRDGAPTDTFLALFDRNGQPVPRVRLQAVRDSHITFRGIDSRTFDIRLQHWEEMDLNQYVYLNGEVVRLFLYPRGPDSGFQLDHHRGRRITFFETTATAHALHEPCYVVRPLAAGAEPVPNGLPVFHLYYQNDDDREGRWKGDSLLTFVVPQDGEYWLRVTDARGIGGPDFRYRLMVRRPRPSYTVKVVMPKKTVNAGSGKEFEVVADRIDGFAGPIRIDVSGFPEGWYVTSPLVIEADRYVARGCVMALGNAKELTDDQRKSIRVTATATVGGTEVTRDVAGLTDIRLGPRPKLIVSLSPPGNSEGSANLLDADRFPRPAELVIRPGETIRARLRVARYGYHGRVQFESLKLNLPHGVYVDNIGLNGVLIPEGKEERTVYLTAAPWVGSSRRLVFFKAQQEGTQTSFPLWLVVDDQPAKR